MHAVQFLSLLSLGFGISKGLLNDNSSYTVAVVGLSNNNIRNGTLKISMDDWLLRISQRYNDVVEKAFNQSGNNLEIIVFPESVFEDESLNLNCSTEIPEPFTESICNSNSTKYKAFLIELSCIAKKYNTTLVVNVVEKYNCSSGNDKLKNCSRDGIVYHNTNVAFNGTGHVSGRYRKYNLYGEYGLSPPSKPELITFTTKNGIVFGMFTCFDILFDKPALDLVRKKDVRNIIFPNRWFSELPFLTALQVQQMWAHENNVNLFAAGYNEPVEGSWGTGVYLGDKGPAYLELNYRDEPSFGLYNVGINNSGNVVNYTAFPDDYDQHLTSFKLKQDITVPRYRSKLMPTNKMKIIEEVCDGKLCCQFNITISMNNINNNTSNFTSNTSNYTYHLVAFNGMRTFAGFRDANIQQCGVIACLNESIHSCGLRFPDASNISWTITFENICVSGNFSSGLNNIQFPNSLTSNLIPITPSNTLWSKEQLSKVILRRSHELKKPVKKLLTFGIFGRTFDNVDNSIVVDGVGQKSAGVGIWFQFQYYLMLSPIVLIFRF